MTASDLATKRLEQARIEDIIQGYRRENAESMTAEDDSFDVVLCKEAFHHMPRPWIGLYEMLRVARNAVILIKPRDWILDKGSIQSTGPRGLFRGLAAWVGTRLRGLPKPAPAGDLFRLGDEPGYEETGNYVFSVSSREIEKVALGMNLPAIGFFAVNDGYEEGLWKSDAVESNSTFRRMRKLLEGADRVTRSGIGSSSLLVAALFIEMPPPPLQSCLADAGWQFKALKRNPYITQSNA